MCSADIELLLDQRASFKWSRRRRGRSPPRAERARRAGARRRRPDRTDSIWRIIITFVRRDENFVSWRIIRSFCIGPVRVSRRKVKGTVRSGPFATDDSPWTDFRRHFGKLCDRRTSRARPERAPLATWRPTLLVHGDAACRFSGKIVKSGTPATAAAC
ncbi:hypothetical protein EVAR_40641_1 [Eumeta japonica]|uniref:Uncharacterized protein n=1 Tax=Eumeta variegata TaxID=151549 RepID=A0A4C1X2Y8_EUMVA|nr:hypothetical protein EVAR_40641_1 [Eumeta japonica]